METSALRNPARARKFKSHRCGVETEISPSYPPSRNVQITPLRCGNDLDNWVAVFREPSSNHTVAVWKHPEGDHPPLVSTFKSHRCGVETCPRAVARTPGRVQITPLRCGNFTKRVKLTCSFMFKSHRCGVETRIRPPAPPRPPGSNHTVAVWKLGPYPRTWAWSQVQITPLRCGNGFAAHLFSPSFGSNHTVAVWKHLKSPILLPARNRSNHTVAVWKPDRQWPLAPELSVQITPLRCGNAPHVERLKSTDEFKSHRCGVETDLAVIVHAGPEVQITPLRCGNISFDDSILKLFKFKSHRCGVETFSQITSAVSEDVQITPLRCGNLLFHFVSSSPCMFKSHRCGVETKVGVFLVVDVHVQITPLRCGNAPASPPFHRTGVQITPLRCGN